MFRLVERPALMPARSLTGSTVGPVVDTEVILPNGGRVYVTELEAGELIKYFPAQIRLRAAEMGWETPDAVAEQAATIERLESELAEAQSGQPRFVSLEDARQLLTA